MRAFMRRSVAAGLVVAFTTVACGEVVEVDPRIASVQSNVKSCSDQLAAGNYDAAIVAADQVFKANNNYADLDHLVIDQLRFCRGMSRTFKSVDALTTSLANLLTMVLGLMGGDNPLFAPTPEEVAAFVNENPEVVMQALAEMYPNANGIGGIVLGFFGDLEDTLRSSREELKKVKLKNRFSYSIVSLPVKIAGQTLVDIGGDYDMGEIELLYGLSESIIAIFDLAHSIDYTVSGIGPTVSYALNSIDDAETPLGRAINDGTHWVSAVSNLYAVLLGLNPSFLGLEPENGKNHMNQAGQSFSLAWDGLLKSVKHMKFNRKGPQERFLVEYVREDDKDFFIFHVQFKKGVVPIVEIDKLSDIKVPLSENIQTSMENLRDSFAGSGKLASLQNDIFPMVALFTSVLLSSGAFQALIDLALASVDEGLAGQAQGLIDAFAGNTSLIEGLLQTAVPITVKFDFGKPFKEPKGLRDVLPGWFMPPSESGTFSDTAMLPNLVTAEVILSYECSDGLNPLKGETEELFCAEAADTGHFEPLVPFGAANWEDRKDALWVNYPGMNNILTTGLVEDDWKPVDADGIKSIIPALGFKDASMGGLIYLDVEQLRGQAPLIEAPAAGEGTQLANQQTLNAWIAATFGAILGLF